MKKLHLLQKRFWLILIFCTVFVSLTQTLNLANVPAASDYYSCNGQQMTAAQIAEYRGIPPEMMQLLHDHRGLTAPEICEMAQGKLERAIFKVNNPKRPNQPDEALKLRNLQLQDENGFIPADGLIVADVQIEAMAQEVGIAGAGITSGSWAWLGPGNIGGRVRSLLIHPDIPATMWVGSVTGGIWKTTDGGASWQIIDDFMANMSVSTMVMHPNDPDILYAGTGEGFYALDYEDIGAGVFKTIDGGTNWSQLPSTNNSDFYTVNRLVISPDGNTILAATSTDIFLSTDDGNTWTPSGIGDVVLDVDFDPLNGTRAVAGGWGGKAWYSINGGANWIAAGGLPGLDRVEVAYAPSNPSIVYASVDNNGGEIWKSTNGGETYVLVNTGNNYLGDQGFYDNIIWVDPTNAARVIVGGIDLWRSTNSGATLTKISRWDLSPPSAHADHHIIVEHPDFNGSTNKIVYFGNDGGVYKANNVYTVAGIIGWTELNNNLGITQYYSAAGHPSTGALVGGTQDNGTLFYTTESGAEGWESPYGGDGGFSAYDPTDPNYFYGEYIWLTIHRNDSGGEFPSYDIYSGIEDADTQCALFIAPFILDPNNANTMLAGGCSLWRSADVKAETPAWSAIKTDAVSYISAIAVAPGNSDVIWVGYDTGEVYKTINGTNASPTWTRVDTNSPGLPNRYVTRMTIDQNDNNKVYVTFGGFSPDNVWRTTNGGTSWTDISGSGITGLPFLPARSLVIHPANSNWLYLGTELGIFTSENGGTNWTLPQDGPTNTSVDELFWMNTALVAATYGRGVFKTETLPCRTLTLAIPPEGGKIKASPTPNCVGDAAKYSSGTVVTLTAQPKGGYSLLNWGGDASGSINPINITMSMNKSVSAVFFAALPAPSLRSPRTSFLTSDTTPTFWWTDVRGGQTYEIEFANDNTFTTIVDSEIVNGAPYTAVPPFGDGQYYWRIRAKNASSQPGVWSSSRTFTVDTAGPPAPELSLPANSASSNRTPTFRWLSVPIAASYQFEYDDSSNLLSPLYTVTVRGIFRKPPAMPVGTYYWHVRAKDSAGNWGPWSAPFTVTIASP